MISRRRTRSCCFVAWLTVTVVLSLGGAELPASVDLRPSFKEWGLTQRLQGGRGTCSVFAMVGAIEYALAHKEQRGTILSPEFLNWASNDVTQSNADGSFFSDLWTGFERHGICPESDQPYRDTFDPALKPAAAALEHASAPKAAGLRLHWIKPWDVQTGLTEGQFAEIKQTLARRWPVCGGMRWPRNEVWEHGVLKMVPSEEVFDGHSVLLVGFRDDPSLPGGGVFLIRNSGRGEPDSSLSYAYARAYINDAVWIDHKAP